MADKTNKEKVVIKFTIGEDTEIKDRIVIVINGTGLNINKQDHFRFLEELTKVLSAQMYAKSQGIAMDKV